MRGLCYNFFSKGTFGLTAGNLLFTDRYLAADHLNTLFCNAQGNPKKILKKDFSVCHMSVGVRVRVPICIQLERS